MNSNTTTYYILHIKRGVIHKDISEKEANIIVSSFNNTCIKLPMEGFSESNVQRNLSDFVKHMYFQR